MSPLGTKDTKENEGDAAIFIHFLNPLRIQPILQPKKYIELVIIRKETIDQVRVDIKLLTLYAD